MAQAEALKIPQPPAKPIVGHALSLDPHSPVKSLLGFAKQLGPIFELDLMGAGRVRLGRELREGALRRESVSTRRCAAAGARARHRRRRACSRQDQRAELEQGAQHPAGAVRRPAMQSYHPAMVDIAEQLCLKWARLNSGREIDVVHDMTALTLDTIGLCGFDYRFNLVLPARLQSVRRGRWCARSRRS